jgi:hypothetical protein
MPRIFWNLQARARYRTGTPTTLAAPTAHVARVFLVAGLALLTGCADDVLDPAPATAVRSADGIAGPRLSTYPAYAGEPVGAEEWEAAELVARTLAVGLADPAARATVKEALSRSTAKEGKLHFASYFQGRGGAVLNTAFNLAGTRADEFQRAVARIRDLEFYMPIRAHREIWVGGPVMVGAGLDEDKPAVVFDQYGNRTTLSQRGSTDIPLLILTPSETNFGDQIEDNLRGRASACSALPAETLESAIRRCGPAPGGPIDRSVSPFTSPAFASSMPLGPAGLRPRFYDNLATDPSILGLYATFIRVLDTGEPAWRGDPELELHVLGRTSGTSQSPIDYQCIGEHAGNPNRAGPGMRSLDYVFDQNNHFWEGSVKLLSPTQMDELQSTQPEGFNISVWEDDDTACLIKETNPVGEFIKAAAAVGAGVVASVGKRDPTVVAGSILGAAGLLYDLIKGNDDFVGVLVDKNGTQWASEWPASNTHAILRGSELNGRATVQMRTTYRAGSVIGPSQVQPSAGDLWFASYSGTSGPVTVTFAIDGVSVQSGSTTNYYFTNQGNDFTISATVTDSYGVVGASSMDVMVSSCEPGKLECAY